MPRAHTMKAVPSLGPTLDLVFAAIGRYWRRRALRRHLTGLDDAQLDDIGIRRRDIETVVREI